VRSIFITYELKIKLKMKRLVLIGVCVCALFLGVSLNSCKPSDRKLQAAVEAVLKAIPDAPPDLTSAVKDGVVTLAGTVETEEDRTAIETAVKAVKGLKGITNNIRIAPPIVVHPDEEIFNTISEALAAAGFDKVAAAVRDGIVTLTGESDKADLEKIMQIAGEAYPKQVLNQITLK
jgi:osmotically-inducible protein OsmY